MALAPKTKLWIGLGVFALAILGLMSLNSDTFSGNLTLLPRITPQQCVDLKKACNDPKDPKPIACENYVKIDCDRVIAENKAPENNVIQKPTAPVRARPKVPAKPAPSPATHGAAPSASDKGTSTGASSISTSAADLQKVLQTYPESPSRGTLDTSKMR